MADFIYSPDFSYEVKPRYQVNRTKFENNYDQRRLITSTKLRMFRLVFNNRSTTEMSAVKTFFDSKKGSLTSFTLNIESEDVRGIFVEESFTHSRIAPNVYSYQFDFEEVLA
jgi:phage-related protein